MAMGDEVGEIMRRNANPSRGEEAESWVEGALGELICSESGDNSNRGVSKSDHGCRVNDSKIDMPWLLKRQEFEPGSGATFISYFGWLDIAQLQILL